MDLALHDLAVSFGPDLSGQVYPESLASLTFLTIAGGLTEKGELEAMVVTTLEWILFLLMDVDPYSAGKRDDEMGADPPTIESVL